MSRVSVTLTNVYGSGQVTVNLRCDHCGEAYRVAVANGPTVLLDHDCPKEK